MTDRQFLGLNQVSNKNEITRALIKKISDLDFEIDIDLIFKYIQCAERLHQQLKNSNSEGSITVDDLEYDTVPYLTLDETYDTPDKLISHFKTLYENTDARFNKLFWKLAIERAKSHNGDKLETYCEPIADFLLKHSFLKSDTLRLIANAFPFVGFFPDPKDPNNEEFWKKYGRVYHLLTRGNFELDLHADAINTGQYTSAQLDDIYLRLTQSIYYYRQKEYSHAFNILSQLPPETKPLLVWQRELAIVHKVHVRKNDENLKSIFINSVNSAISFFPDDEHLLFIRCEYIFHTSNPETSKDEIIATLKRIPGHHQCLFLLGKCYMKLGLSRAALTIFENLKKLNPLNMEYVTAAALASRKYIDFCINEHDPNDNDKAYYIKMISELIDLSMFDEIEIFAAQAPKEDADIKALLMYAKAVEVNLFQGKKEKELLLEAITLTKDKEIIRKIKELYLKDIPNWSEIETEKEFILEYYNAYPKDAMANYHMGMSYHAIADYENAYQYFVKAKEIDPTNLEIYYNLSRATSMTERYEEAIEYIKTYLLYRKYNINANEYYCEWTYWIKDYHNAHLGAKWLLSLCNKNEFRPKYFFYFTAGLSLFLDSVDKEKHNHAYIKDMLELYDQYPKPATFWTDDYGSKSMYWCAKLSFDMGDYDRCINYLLDILKNVKEYNWSLMESCLYDLLPKSLQAAGRFEELLEHLVTPTQDLLIAEESNPLAALPAFYISHAYSKLENIDKQMEWAMICAYCYFQSENTPYEWVENYLANKFEDCLEFDIRHFIYPIGRAYLVIIPDPNAYFIYVTHYMGNILAALDNQEEALEYHNACIKYGTMFPDEYTDLVAESKQIVENLTPSDTSK